jgi:hypothetical protein
MFTLQAGMRIFNIFLFSACLVFASELRVSAWSGSGHMVTAPANNYGVCSHLVDGQNGFFDVHFVSQILPRLGS